MGEFNKHAHTPVVAVATGFDVDIETLLEDTEWIQKVNTLVDNSNRKPYGWKYAR